MQPPPINSTGYLSERVDRALRKSPLGSHISRLRKLAPNLYTALRSAYSVLFHLNSAHGLARYQERALRHFLAVVPESIRNTGILEIGSDLDARVLRELRVLGCGTLIGINPAFSAADLARINPTLPEGSTLRVADMRDTGLPDASLGAVFSVSVFEHLPDFKRCLAEMHRILIPGGIVYAEFGPIWSSSIGHHVCADAEGRQARHWDPRLNPLADFSHLLQSPDEMRTELAGKVPDQLAGAILRWVYESDDINRLLFEDYERLLDESPFEVLAMDIDREHVPEAILVALRNRHPRYTVFDVRNVELVLRKRP